MDANYTVDETLGEQEICIDQLTFDDPQEMIFDFPYGSRVHTVITLRKKYKFYCFLNAKTTFITLKFCDKDCNSSVT